MSKQTSLAKDYTWSYTEEPHKSRRKAILETHPEVKDLYGYDPNSKYWVILSVMIQFIVAWALRNQNWWVITVAAYLVGGTINHSLNLAGHELSHNLFFDNPLHNTLFGFVANLPMVLAITVTFQKYHLIHHRYQGEITMDPDLPTLWEGKLFQSRILKFCFLCLQPFIYTLRPLLGQPMPMTKWEIIQWIFQLSVDYVIYLTMGWKSLMYLLMSTFLGSSFHPMAGHFVAEHYEWIKGSETYSYYGILNYLTYNVGYHNEHHDFPRIPGSRLPLLKKMAPEFYDKLPSHTSWVAVMWRFIVDPEISPFARTVRDKLNGLGKNPASNGKSSNTSQNGKSSNTSQNGKSTNQSSEVYVPDEGDVVLPTDHSKSQ